MSSAGPSSTGERRAFVSPKPDGRAFVGINGSAEDAIGYWDDLTLLAKLTFGADDPRTLDQQRADLALQLPGFALSSRHGHGPSLRSWLELPDEQDSQEACALARRNDLTPAQQRRTQAVVLVPVQTGLGFADDPGELVGYGPVSAAHARDLLAAAELRKACVDVTSGRLIALSDDIVRPPAWSGRHWASAYPALQPVELSSHHPGPPGSDPPTTDPPTPPGGSPPGGSPPRPGAPPGPAAPTGAPAPPGSAPPGAATPPSPSAPQGPSEPPPGAPVTLFDALMQMVHALLPAESRVEPRHDPSPGLADLVRLRDPRCIGPGCSMPSRCCDLEHWRAHPHGDTAADNLGPASRRCHNAKTFGGWGYTPHPDGSITWTSPWGRTYRKASRTRPVDLHDLTPRRTGPPPHQRPPE